MTSGILLQRLGSISLFQASMPVEALLIVNPLIAKAVSINFKLSGSLSTIKAFNELPYVSNMGGRTGNRKVSRKPNTIRVAVKLHTMPSPKQSPK